MDIKSLSNEALAAFISEKRTALDALFAIENPTPEQVEQAEALAADVIAGTTEQDERTQKAAASAEKFADLKKQFSEQPAEEEAPEEEAPAEEAPAEEAPKEEKVEVNVEQAGGKVTALAAKTKRPAAPERTRGRVTLTAAANVDGFSTGQTLADTLDIAKASIARAKGFSPPTGDGTREDIQKFGIASIAIPFEEDLIIDRNTDVDEVLKRAADESRLTGGSLTAAGGWCAPSETLYDVGIDATTEGLVSLPEVAIRRGGMRFTKAPDFSVFYANPGFVQTEAQAIAGTTKPCIEVNCPTFTDVRLDAEGVCIRIPILTNAGYPEYVRTFIDGTLVAHQHWISANVIARMVAFAGAARVMSNAGSTAIDTLTNLELLADQKRQEYRLGLGQTLEVLVPFWVKGAIRSDLAARQGQANSVAISDAEVKRHFSSRNLNVQFVYNWQALPLVDNAGTAGRLDQNLYPTTFDALLYPAGTFVKGTADIINLSNIYDAASLATNVYTGLFTEQGLLVANPKFTPTLATIGVCSAGRTGAANLVQCFS